jgi:hypothetical protein
VWSNQTTRETSRTRNNFLAVGRLRPHVATEQAQSELTAIGARLEQEYPDSNKGRGVAVTRLQDVLVDDVRLTLYLLWGVVGVVLLIACANTATLLLGKATARTREIAVRAALGASRSRIVRQLITESLLLAFVAGAAGLVLAAWGVRVLTALTPADVVRLAGAGIDRGVLLFTLGVTVATSLLFGLIPALHASRVDLIDAMKQGGAGAVSGASMVRTRSLLVVSEIALAVVLLTGAGLLVKSLLALHRAELGFQSSNVLVMKATGIRASFPENNAFFEEIMSRIGALPALPPSAPRRYRRRIYPTPATARISSIACRRNGIGRRTRSPWIPSSRPERSPRWASPSGAVAISTRGMRPTGPWSLSSTKPSCASRSPGPTRWAGRSSALSIARRA